MANSSWAPAAAAWIMPRRWLRARAAPLRISFEPLAVRPIPLPADWGFLVAHSLETAEKSGSAREAYNARRAAGYTALRKMGFASYREALERDRRLDGGADAFARRVRRLSAHHQRGAARGRKRYEAMESADAACFGQLLLESHASLRDRLRVSSRGARPVGGSRHGSGALGARLTGAGFGGCAVVFARKRTCRKCGSGLTERFYAGRAGISRNHSPDRRRTRPRSAGRPVAVDSGISSCNFRPSTGSSP